MTDWTSLNADGDPLLVVGRRPGPKKLEGFVVELHQDTFGAMRDIASKAISELDDSTPVDWHPDVAVESGDQYAVIDVHDVSMATGRGNRPAELEDEADLGFLLSDAAALLRIVLSPGRLDSLHPSQLAEGDFRFMRSCTKLVTLADL